MTELVGQIINGYTIKAKIGSGGQSAVYLASHEKFEEDVALRGTLPDFAQDSETVKRFQMEAVIFFRLKHQYIIPLLDYWRNDHGTWLVQKYMAGGSLRDRINAPEPMPLNDITNMLGTISQALDYTHRNHIIHRDIKPDNILYDDQGVAHVHDFGVAKRLKSDTITRADVMIGSPAYLSPEQITKQKITPQTDVYIMAITLFEALTKQHPFHDAHTKMQLILKHLRSPLPSVSDYREDIPDDVDDVLRVASAKLPDERYSSMGDLFEAFRSAIAVKE